MQNVGNCDKKLNQETQICLSETGLYLVQAIQAFQARKYIVEKFEECAPCRPVLDERHIS